MLWRQHFPPPCYFPRRNCQVIAERHFPHPFQAISIFFLYFNFHQQLVLRPVGTLSSTHRWKEIALGWLELYMTVNVVIPLPKYRINTVYMVLANFKIHTSSETEIAYTRSEPTTRHPDALSDFLLDTCAPLQGYDKTIGGLITVMVLLCVGIFFAGIGFVGIVASEQHFARPLSYHLDVDVQWKGKVRDVQWKDGYHLNSYHLDVDVQWKEQPEEKIGCACVVTRPAW